MSRQDQLPNAGRSSVPKGSMRSRNSLRISAMLILAIVCLAMVFPVPRSLVASILSPLTVRSTTDAVNCLHCLGVPVVREGDQIHLENQSVAITPVDAGLRQTIGFLASVAVVAFSGVWTVLRVLVFAWMLGEPAIWNEFN